MTKYREDMYSVFSGCYLVCFLILALANIAIAQSLSEDHLWRKIEPDNRDILLADSQVPRETKIFYHLDPQLMSQKLSHVPKEFPSHQNGRVISVPYPNGSFHTFRIFTSDTMEPKLKAATPQISTFKGYGVDDLTATARFEFSYGKFYGMVKSSSGTFYIDPIRTIKDGYFSVLSSQTGINQNRFRCSVTDSSRHKNNPASPSNINAKHHAFVFASEDNQLRIYRIAIAANHFYVDAVYDSHLPGVSTKQQALTAINRTLNRVNLIYETEFGIRMILVDSEKSIIYDQAADDKYSNDDAAKANSYNQENLDKVIGSDHYDIGHVFTTGTAGLAQVQAVCDHKLKAMGSTGIARPTGDAFDVDYVAHEIGHQFGANHSFNGTIRNCSTRNAKTAYEPASGTTIMGYSGSANLCTDDKTDETVQDHSDAYFHAVSLGEITDYITNTSPDWGGSCPTLQATTNHSPVLDENGRQYKIPRLTPFVLDSKPGKDDDKDDQLTYGWEELDLGEAAPPDADTDSKARPLFRSFSPVPSTRRSFPNYDSILAGDGNAKFEALPSIQQTMVFRLTVRDGKGRYAYSDSTVYVDGASGPFKVSSPSTDEKWSRAKEHTITWDVASTDKETIKCLNVKISLIDSDDPTNIVTVGSLPNSGNALITIPNTIETGKKVHIKIEAENNIFYTVSGSNIEIGP
jgi:hypothetical protein